MLGKEFERPLGNARKGLFLDDKIHHIIWSYSYLKWISIHALGFPYGDQIRKISTCQNRRKNVILHTKDKGKMAKSCKGAK